MEEAAYSPFGVSDHICLRHARIREEELYIVCSPDAPAGGMQDLDMESAALEEAIKLYNKNLWEASSCKMKACGDDDEF
jgi:hypothetical protein